MREQEQWNLKDIFENKEAYDREKENCEKLLQDIKEKEGSLAKSAENLESCYRTYEKALCSYERIYSYAMLYYHLDMAKPEAIKLYQEAENLGTKFSEMTAFVEPELLEMEEEKLRAYIQNPCLQKYKRILEKLLEEKRHTLSKKQEEMLASYAEVFAGAENTFDTFTNTELKLGKIQIEGREEELTDANYSNFLKNNNQLVRKQAFEKMYDAYKNVSNTITQLYMTRVKEAVTTAKVRNYPSSLERAVKEDDGSLFVYENLVKVARENLSKNHEFMKLKKQLLNLPEIHLYDIYANPLETEKDEITYEEAKKEVLQGLSILGEEYTQLLQQAFENRWIDVYPKQNKRSGAYSMDVYGVHPYVLLNFVNSKRDVSTIAHELGHSMHSYYASHTQGILDANYTIMVAEVASTVNEILLAEYQIQQEQDKQKKQALLYELLEMIRATFFRQTMFAEFEKKVHESIEKGKMLSAQDLNKIYYQLNEDYFGKEVVIDKEIQYEWERIPHFYTPFYVYKYATGISAAITIASNILAQRQGYKEKYIDMLKQGCMKKSIDLLKMVDVDLETEKPYEITLQYFKEKMRQLESLS